MLAGHIDEIGVIVSSIDDKGFLFRDLAYVTIIIVGEIGFVVKHAKNEVSFEVARSGDLITLRTTNLVSENIILAVNARHLADA